MGLKVLIRLIFLCVVFGAGFVFNEFQGVFIRTDVRARLEKVMGENFSFYYFARWDGGYGTDAAANELRKF